MSAENVSKNVQELLFWRLAPALLMKGKNGSLRWRKESSFVLNIWRIAKNYTFHNPVCQKSIKLKKLILIMTNSHCSSCVWLILLSLLAQLFSPRELNVTKYIITDYFYWKFLSKILLEKRRDENKSVFWKMFVNQRISWNNLFFLFFKGRQKPSEITLDHQYDICSLLIPFFFSSFLRSLCYT